MNITTVIVLLVVAFLVWKFHTVIAAWVKNIEIKGAAEAHKLYAEATLLLHHASATAPAPAPVVVPADVTAPVVVVPVVPADVVAPVVPPPAA